MQFGNLVPAASAQVTLILLSGTSETISNLTVSAGADLFTNSNQLTVPTQTTVAGTGSTLRIDPHATAGTVAFQTPSLALNNGGAQVMSDGIANVPTLFEVNARRADETGRIALPTGWD